MLVTHMFFFLFTCMEEWPAMSRADFQARRDSSQGNWTSYSQCHVNCCHTVAVHTHSTRCSLFFYPRLNALSFNGSTFTQILNVVLHLTSQGQAVSQGLSSRTVTSVSLIFNLLFSYLTTVFTSCVRSSSYLFHELISLRVAL